MKFGEKLKEIREINNIKIDKLAKKLNIKSSEINKWEISKSYPSAKELIELCKILHCSIKEFTNENITDSNKLSKEVQNYSKIVTNIKNRRMKKLSKIIYKLSNLIKKMSVIAIIFITIITIIYPIIISNINIDKNNKTIKYFKNEIKYSIEDDQLLIGNYKIKISNDDQKNINDIETYIYNYTNTNYIFAQEIQFALSLIVIIFTYILFNNLEKLFKNIYNDIRPFTYENTAKIKNILNSLIIIILLPGISDLLYSAITNTTTQNKLEFIDIIYVIILVSISYLFEYEYEKYIEVKK